MAERQPALVTPFWVRIATETSLSPGWLLIAFPAVLYPTYLALEVLFGRGLAAATDFGGDYEARRLPIIAVVLGYLSMVLAYLARGTFRDLEALRPVLQGGQVAYADLWEQLTRFDRRRLWTGTLIALALGVALQEIIYGRWTSLLAGQWSLREPCVTAAALAGWILIGLGAVYLIESARVYSRIGERHVEVDLLDLATVSRLAHHGLRIVLFLTVITAALVISTVVGVEANAPSITSFWVWMFVVCSCNLVVVTAAFVLPVRGLRRQIRTRKAEKLAQLRDEIRQHEELMTKPGTDSAEAGARLPGLLAFEKRIESVREWPFDAPTLARFFLYVAIPLGSWIGGALVERLLGAALD
jgi:hypothetical protein